MNGIDRRATVALGLLGGGTAAASAAALAAGRVRAQEPQQQPAQDLARGAPSSPQQRFVERLVEACLVLSFAAEPDALRRWLPRRWEPQVTPLGPHRGSTLFLTLCERLGRQGTDGGAAAPTPRRYAALAVSVRERADRRMGFVPVRVWLPAAAVPAFPYGAARAAEVEREVTERGSGGEPATVREAWAVRPAEGGGQVRLLLEYRRADVLARAPYQLRVLSAPEVMPPLDHVYQLDRLMDVLRGEDADDPRLVRLELEATVPEMREAFGGGAAPRPRAVVAEPLLLRDLPAG
jgi:hypothetical protein